MNKILGQLIPEEQTQLIEAHRRAQQSMLRIGELVFQASQMRQKQQALEMQISALREKESIVAQEQQKICEDLDLIENEGRQIMNQVGERLGLQPDIRWVAMQDGTIQQVE